MVSVETMLRMQGRRLNRLVRLPGVRLGLEILGAVLGALFVGVGVGLIVRQGGSSGGDDALALSIAKAVKCRISYAYLFTDLTVLTLSLSYIPFKRIAYSLITVTLSSWIIDFFQKGKKNA